MSEALLDVRNLTKRFGGLVAVQDLSFHVDQGEVVGLIGPNGAGKTTIFNMITGMYRPSSGEVLFDGRDITGAKPYRLVGFGLARTFQLTTLFAGLSVLENVVVARHLHARGYGYLGSAAKTRRSRGACAELERGAREILEIVGIDDVRDKPSEELPHGHQRLLEIAIALATEPRLILLDEPVTGMNAVETATTVDLVRRINHQLGVTVLMIEHDMRVVMGICERIVAIDFGAKIAEGAPVEISSNEAVIAAYLGAEEVA